jgi:hypothetical protein
MKKMQSSTIHLGNIGEHKIASLLSPFCIVRNVAQGTDTGIDLYCEILKENDLKPTLHFFCQAKTRKNHIQHSEIKKDLHYWANQPVPVFVFLMKYSNEKTINSESEVWVYDIPYLIAMNDAKEQGMKIKRDVKERFLICDEDNNKDRMKIKSFLYGHVSFSYGIWQMRRGLVLPNPEIEDNMPEVLVGGLTKIYKEKIEKQILYAKNLMEKEN